MNEDCFLFWEILVHFQLKKCIFPKNRTRKLFIFFLEFHKKKIKLHPHYRIDEIDISNFTERLMLKSRA